MRNQSLAADYVLRAGKRLQAVETLLQLEAWADAVRESQEIVELALKGLLRHGRIEPPRLHDVSEVLRENSSLYSPALKSKLEQLVEISRRLRRDRELAFYGSEDLTPSQFYREKDAREAVEGARIVVSAVHDEISPAASG
jgi:HEPN domain-containing protein